MSDRLLECAQFIAETIVRSNGVRASVQDQVYECPTLFGAIAVGSGVQSTAVIFQDRVLKYDRGNCLYNPSPVSDMSQRLEMWGLPRNRMATTELLTVGVPREGMTDRCVHFDIQERLVNSYDFTERYTVLGFLCLLESAAALDAYDLHRQNWGYRPSDIADDNFDHPVIFDLGFTKPTGYYIGFNGTAIRNDSCLWLSGDAGENVMDEAIALFDQKYPNGWGNYR